MILGRKKLLVRFDDNREALSTFLNVSSERHFKGFFEILKFVAWKMTSKFKRGRSSSAFLSEQLREGEFMELAALRDFTEGTAS